MQMNYHISTLTIKRKKKALLFLLTFFFNKWLWFHVRKIVDKKRDFKLPHCL